MSDPTELPMEEFGVLCARAGFVLTDEEARDLKGMWERVLPDLAALHAVDLGEGDLAVSFEPSWDPDTEAL
ncbi:MAG: hypothetical protein FI707_04520 [SAR202 cluster bacterium]|jgi:hypothetical protein|nr:hypothetical protein [Chloroflexota bacterium]MDP6419795.1 hypothetical protein [SAR202 cluster bacterium]HAL46528.1 hypothetical protein [Dehalococcoidia bacterium]MDP6662594.1 hypothetical protein [SAR202 cluster bacterium]MDP6798414.1 hypothetical protein [SAR202 cluster bacterium]|tara:strand:+ start:4751 stop:4963 length:213 start_codon:yes stop_codon:yes gene_type:complete